MRYHTIHEEGPPALGSRQMSGRRRPRPPSFNRSRPTTNNANQASSDTERPITIVPSSSHRRSAGIPPAVVIAPSIDNRAANSTRSNRSKSIFFSLLVVASILYTDSPLSTSVRAVYDFVSLDASTAGSADVGSAPAFSTSHSREMKFFGGGSSSDSNDARNAAALAKFQAATAPMESRGKRGGGGRGRKMPHNIAHNMAHRVRNGKRRPRLAHARDPTYEQPQQSSESDRRGSDAVPQSRNLHPRERLLTRPTGNDNGDAGVHNDATHSVSSKLSQGENAEAAGHRKVISRFVFKEDPSHPNNGGSATSLNLPQQDVGGSNLIMAMVGIIVGLGAVVSLAVLLFLSDQPIQIKRQHGSSRAESVVQHRRSTSGGSSSNTSTLSGSASLESIDEEAGDNGDEEEQGMVGAADGTRRRRQQR